MKIGFSVLALFISSTLIAQVPAISSFSPASGPVGTQVTITGTNFSATPVNNTVYFGAVKANVSAAMAASITVTVPSGANYQPISVATGGLIAYSASPFNITYTGGGSVFDASSFATATSFSGGGFLAEGDLSGDGKVDIVYSHFTGNYITVYKNTTAAGGAVSFTSGFSQSLVNPICVKTADINGDGWLDLIAANSTLDVVYVLRNNTASGFFGFALPVSFGTGAEPRKITIADIDKDGKADIITANQTGNSISILRNTSVGNTISFATKVDFTTALTPEGVSAGDLNNDGKTDMMVACSDANVVSVFKNTSVPGAVSLDPKADYGVGSFPWDVAAADIDGDGKPDMVSSSTGPNTVSVFRNTSSSGISFAARVQLGTTSSPRGLTINDFDGDGKPDIVTANYFSSSNVSVLKNTSVPGTVSFNSFNSYTTGTGTGSVVAADFDNDGLADIMTANSQSNSLSFLRNQLPVITTIPTCPVLVSPASNAVINYGIPYEFKWRKITNATGYRVRIIEQGGAYTEDNLTDTSYLFTPSALTYTWNVTPLNMPIPNTTCLSGAFNTCPATPTSITIAATGSTDKCFLDSVKLTAISATNIQWFLNNQPIAGATSDIFWAKSQGNYKVRVVSGSCYSDPTNTITITNLPAPLKPSLVISGSLSFCGSGSVTLTSSLVNINNQWFKNTTAIAGANGNSYVANETGAFYLRVTNSTSGCPNYSDTANVVITPVPATPTISAGSATTFCQGGSVVLTSSAVPGNQWKLNGNNITGATGNTYTATASGNYSVIVTSNGCTSAVSEGTSVTVNPIPTTPVITGSTGFCPGGSVTLTSNAASGNQWYKDNVSISGATATTYAANAAGAYKVIATVNGCASASSNIKNVTQNPAPPIPVVNWSGTQLSTASGLSGYQWFLNNAPIAGATNGSHNPASTGLYKVTITDVNGCTATSVDFNQVATAVNDITLSGVRYTISPNPANGFINLIITGNNPGKAKLKLINSTGTEIMVWENVSSAKMLEVAILPAGLYYLQVSTKKEKGTFKVVITH